MSQQTYDQHGVEITNFPGPKEVPVGVFVHNTGGFFVGGGRKKSPRFGIDLVWHGVIFEGSKFL